MKELLELLEKNSSYSTEQLAVMLNTTKDDIEKTIKQYKEDGIIIAEKALIDWEKAGSEKVTAFIELKITPQYGLGFDKIAERLYEYDEIKTIWLMSGAFDLALIIEGKTMKEVALFVAETLAPMEQVLSTSTSFVLKTYKDCGFVFKPQKKDERGFVSL